MDKNRFGFLVFFIIVALIIGGGYYLMQESYPEKEKKESKTNHEEIKDIRLDTTKDYIYFDNYELIENELDLEYKDVVLNFRESSGIAQSLNDETKEMKSKLTYDKENENAVYKGLTSATYKKYEILPYSNYLTLLVTYFTYTPEELVSYVSSRAYTFNKTTGRIISNDDLLKEFDKSKDSVIDSIKDYVSDQNLLKEGEELSPEGTVENIDVDTLPLYVDKVGRLTASVLVKSDKKDYNDNIILN